MRELEEEGGLAYLQSNAMVRLLVHEQGERGVHRARQLLRSGTKPAELASALGLTEKKMLDFLGTPFAKLDSHHGDSRPR